MHANHVICIAYLSRARLTFQAQDQGCCAEVPTQVGLSVRPIESMGPNLQEPIHAWRRTSPHCVIVSWGCFVPFFLVRINKDFFMYLHMYLPFVFRNMGAMYAAPFRSTRRTLPCWRSRRRMPLRRRPSTSSTTASTTTPSKTKRCVFTPCVPRIVSCRVGA